MSGSPSITGYNFATVFADIQGAFAFAAATRKFVSTQHLSKMHASAERVNRDFASLSERAARLYEIALVYPERRRDIVKTLVEMAKRFARERDVDSAVLGLHSVCMRLFHYHETEPALKRRIEQALRQDLENIQKMATKAKSNNLLAYLNATLGELKR